MTGECSSRKPSFDITKSKRTRRASNVTAESEEQSQKAEEDTTAHVKLKEFIKVDLLEKDTSGEKDQGRALLSQHFAVEKPGLQLVVKQPEDGPQAVKFKKIVKGYVKAWKQLVKFKRGQRLEKPVLRLSM